MDTNSPLLLVLIITGVLGALLLFALTFYGFARAVAFLSGYYSLIARFPTDRPPPGNTGMYQGQLGYLHSASLQVGSDHEGVYLSNPLAGKRAAFIPWTELGAPRTLGKMAVFNVRVPNVTLVVAASVAAKRP